MCRSEDGLQSPRSGTLKVNLYSKMDNPQIDPFVASAVAWSADYFATLEIRIGLHWPTIPCP